MHRTFEVRRLSRTLAVAPLLFACLALMAGCGDDGIKSGGTPKASVNPRKFVFPKLTIGSRDEKVVKVDSRGAGPLIIASVEADFDAQFQLYWYANNEQTQQHPIVEADGVNRFDRLEIESGDSMTLVLEYKPTTNEAPQGNVRLVTNDGDIDLPIEVEQGRAQILVTPTTLDFGRVGAGQEGIQKTRVTNIGQRTLELSQLLINGSQDFHVRIGDTDAMQSPDVLADPDGDGTPGLAPEASVELTVAFTPDNDGPATGELDIRSNDEVTPSFKVNLKANGASPCIKVSPESREFPPAIVNRTDTRPVTIESCGGEALEIRRIYLKEGSSEAFGLGALPNLPAALPAAEAGQPNPSRNIDVAFTPPDQEAYGGTLVIESNDLATCEDPERPETCVVEVPLVGRGILNECPIPAVAESEFNVLPLDVVDLDGSPSTDPDGTIAKYRWVVVSRPDGSTQEPAEGYQNPRRPQDGHRIDDEATPTAKLFIDLAGDYVIELHVIDNLETEAPSDTCPEPVARVSIHAEPNEDIHVQLVWNTPGDRDQTDNEGSDLDLHVLHPSARLWGEAPLDCYFANASPDWGRRGDPADNPSLDIDDIDGAGPENMNLDDPEDTSMYPNGYNVGVHYFRAENFIGGGTWGPSDATMRIYLGGVLSYEKTRNMRGTDNFWHAAQIRWTAAVREVVDVDRFYQSVPIGL